MRRLSERLDSKIFDQIVDSWNFDDFIYFMEFKSMDVTTPMGTVHVDGKLTLCYDQTNGEFQVLDSRGKDVFTFYDDLVTKGSVGKKNAYFENSDCGVMFL